jgi:cell division protein FtsQ
MDGGGRFFGSVTAQSARYASAPAFAGAGSSMLVPMREFLPQLRRSRPRPALRAIERTNVALPRFTGLFLLLVFFTAVGLYGAVRGGQYEDFVAIQGEPRDLVARALGFGIKEVTISGIAELDQTEVLQVAGVDPRGALPFFDAAGARDRLLAVPLVKTATVRKLYPNELEITLTERQPFALWQNHGEVFVVSVDGTVIDKLNDDRFVRLPLVVGEGAAAKAKAFARLMEAAPEVRAHVRAGMLVGQRRWTLKLDNGVEVRLPEEGAAQAIARFATLIREQKILEKDVLAIDMRYPDRVVLRLAENAAEARADAIKAKGKPKGSAI